MSWVQQSYVWVNTFFFLTMLGWSLFAPIAFFVVGHSIREAGK